MIGYRVWVGAPTDLCCRDNGVLCYVGYDCIVGRSRTRKKWMMGGRREVIVEVAHELEPASRAFPLVACSAKKECVASIFNGERDLMQTENSRPTVRPTRPIGNIITQKLTIRSSRCRHNRTTIFRFSVASK